LAERILSLARVSGEFGFSFLLISQRFSIYYMIITAVIPTIKKVFLSPAVGLFNGLSDFRGGFGFKNKDFLNLGKVFTNNIQLIKVLGMGKGFFELLGVDLSLEFVEVLVS
jgi:hypothetical protein